MISQALSYYGMIATGFVSILALVAFIVIICIALTSPPKDHEKPHVVIILVMLLATHIAMAGAAATIARSIGL